MTEFKHDIIIDPEIKPRFAGYLLVETDPEIPSHSTEIMMDGIRRFFGGFGNNAFLFDLGHYKLAVLTPPVLQKLDCISFKREGNDFAFIEGTFYDFDLLRKCKQEAQPIGSLLANRILELCRKEDFMKLKEFNGRYSGFVYISETDTLTIITDQHGANRVFVYNNDQQFAVSNNAIALATNSNLVISINEKSIAEILQLEYPLFRNTEFNEISLILPSDIYVRKNKVIRNIKYYQKIVRVSQKSDSQYISDLNDTINDFFKRLYEYLEEPIGLFMSKGKDSRLFLPFLEMNNIPYIPFVFKDETGIFDYPYVSEIIKLLNKDLHVLESFKVDHRLALMVAMNTTPTISWFTLASVTAEFTNTALIGLYGDIFSGKLATYRSPFIKTKEDLIKRYFSFVSKGVTQDIFDQIFPNYNVYNSWEQYRDLFSDYPEQKDVSNFDLLNNRDYRTFRNAQPIIMRAQHFVNPITPYSDESIALAYHSLPESLVKSQKAHTKIAATESKSNSVRSTAFPISLKAESQLRQFIIEIIKINNRYNNMFLKWRNRKFNPYISADSFTPRSDYFKVMFHGKIPLKVDQKRLLTRMYNVDNYLHLIFHDNLLPLCKTPVIVHNEF